MKLQELAAEHRDAFLEMVADYAVNDPARAAVLFGTPTWNPKKFEAHVKTCQKQRLDWRPPAKKVSITSYVLLGDDGRIYGHGWMRFPLDPKLEREGGNLVFEVPPSVRGQGYGTLTLNRMLFEAVRAGLARVLVTCPSAHTAARKCIEKNRGELERDDGSIARYWIRFR